jgi:hypothetical protein
MGLYLTALFLLVCSVFHGCGTARKSPKWCTISASYQSDSGESTVYNSLIFEDYQSNLMARMLQCGTKDYLMSGYKNSASGQVLEPPELGTAMKWNGVLSCNDLQGAYPHDSQNATDVLAHLCMMEESRAAVGPLVSPEASPVELVKKEEN